jgi:hypothetical protein
MLLERKNTNLKKMGMLCNALVVISRIINKIEKKEILL